MTHSFVFIDRRAGNDRRQDSDPCKDLPVDLFHRKRRKSTDRRDPGRTLSDDYYAYMSSSQSVLSGADDSSPVN